MKNQIYIILFVLISINLIGQEFTTGQVYLKVTNAGSTLFGAPDHENLEITRISALVSGNQFEVFDYLNDADSADTNAYSLETPDFGDFQVQSVFDNSFSFDPPAYKIILNSYGWFNGAYAISHYHVTNVDSFTYQAKFGLEVLPYIGNIYGNEKVEYYNEGEYLRIYRDSLTNYVGLKILNSPVSSIYVEDWVSGYNRSDSLLYNNLFHEGIIDTFTASDSGSVIIPSIASQTVNLNESFDVYIGLAVGTNFAQLDSNMTVMQNRYNEILTTSFKDEIIPKTISLQQNYPNPFNPTTTIEFTIPSKEFVEIVIYNSIGQLIRKLVNKEMFAGSYKVMFDASNLSSGVYFYSLKVGNNLSTKKMLLLK